MKPVSAGKEKNCMLLRDYLTDGSHERKMLIVSGMKDENETKQYFEQVAGNKTTVNVRYITLAQIAEEIRLYDQSAHGFTDSEEVLDDLAAKVLFRDVLLENINHLKYFNEEKMMDLTTAGEIYRMMCLIRTNGLKSGVSPIDRINDLIVLKDKYEAALAGREKLDTVMLLQRAEQIINGWSDKDAELRRVFGAKISYLSEDAEEFSGFEQSLIQLLGASKVSMYENDPDIDDIRVSKDKVTFYKGYGSYNEACCVADDILSKPRHFGTTILLYTSDRQLPEIKSALNGHGIPMCIVSEHPVSDDPYLSLARRILAWADDDFSEKTLEKILSSQVISVKAEDKKDNKEKNVLSGQHYFDHVLNARNRRENAFELGWGYERNVDFIQHEKKHKKEHEKEIAAAKNDDYGQFTEKTLDMHEKLLGIFGDGNSAFDEVKPEVIFAGICDFIKAYTAGSAQRAVALDVLNGLRSAVSAEDRELELSEAVRFIDDIIDEVRTSDPVSKSAVMVRKLTGRFVLNRQAVYVTGLSLADMQGNRMESPALSDSEMEMYLDKGYIPTLSAESERREKDLYRTLATFAGNSLTLGYSSYDTSRFFEQGPSDFYRQMMDHFGVRADDVTEFVYGNPDSGMTEDKKLPEAISVTTLESLIDCPKKYAYSRMLYIPEEEFCEKDYSRWLDAAHRGTFFHELAQQYVEKRMIKPCKVPYDNIDKDEIEAIASDIEKSMLQEVPCAVRQVADDETNDIADHAFSYFDDLQHALNTSGRRILATEYPFDKIQYDITGYNKNTYTFQLRGIIDRIDYQIDSNAKRVIIFLLDYKTGKKDNKETEHELGKILQYFLYEKGIEDSNGNVSDEIKDKVAALEENPNVKNYAFEVARFEYVFPFDTYYVPFSPAGHDISEMRLKCVLDYIKDKKAFPDRMELFEAVRASGDAAGLREAMENAKHDGINYKEITGCRYCAYQDLCENKKSGVIG